jgi:HSP20 family molecular chaperone IbpA
MLSPFEFGLYNLLHDPFLSRPLILAAEVDNHWTQRINITGYNPEEVKITPDEQSHKIVIQGLRKDGEDFSEFKKTVAVPPNVDMKSVRTQFTSSKELLLRGTYKREVGQQARAVERRGNTSLQQQLLGENSLWRSAPRNLFDFPCWHALSDEMRDLQRVINSTFENAIPDAIMPRMEVTEDGGHKMHIDFDVRGYKPEEISVRQVGDDRMVVEAKHESQSEQGSTSRVMYREFTLPKSVKMAEMKSQLKSDGVLSLEAPCELKQPIGEQPKSTEITVQRE